MKQLFIVDSQKRTMEIKENDKTIKTIEDVWIGKNGTELPEKIVEFDQKTPLGLYNLGIAFGTEELNINYPYIKIN
ncbi:MAG: hypothetical protein IJ093_04865, partial [Bacilli bacterium]|nr:hypothetical protein [Bacilli bacterium]